LSWIGNECKPLCGGIGVASYILSTEPLGSEKWRGRLGRAVQVDPIKPMLKAPGTKHLKLKSDELLLSFAFKFNLSRYTWVLPRSTGGDRASACCPASPRWGAAG